MHGMPQYVRTPFYQRRKFRQDPDRGESARQLWDAAQERKKNREQFEKNRSEYENSIRRLMEQIRNTLLVDLRSLCRRKAGREN